VTEVRASYGAAVWTGSARAAGRWLAGDGGRSQNCAPYMGSGRGWLAGDWTSTGGFLNITAAAWTAGFRWWRSGNIRRTRNVSEYMLVLALCLVVFKYFCLCMYRSTWTEMSTDRWRCSYFKTDTSLILVIYWGRKMQRKRHICHFFLTLKHWKAFSFRRRSPWSSDQGLCSWTPPGAPPADSRYRLELRARRVFPPVQSKIFLRIRRAFEYLLPVSIDNDSLRRKAVTV